MDKQTKMNELALDAAIHWHQGGFNSVAEAISEAVYGQHEAWLNNLSRDEYEQFLDLVNMVIEKTKGQSE